MPILFPKVFIANKNIITDGRLKERYEQRDRLSQQFNLTETTLNHFWKIEVTYKQCTASLETRCRVGGRRRRLFHVRSWVVITSVINYLVSNNQLNQCYVIVISERNRRFTLKSWTLGRGSYWFFFSNLHRQHLQLSASQSLWLNAKIRNYHLNRWIKKFLLSEKKKI